MTNVFKDTPEVEVHRPSKGFLDATEQAVVPSLAKRKKKLARTSIKGQSECPFS
jgi:hypothetical protein